MKINLVIREGITIIGATLEKSMNDNNRICVYKDNVLVTSINTDKYRLEYVTDNIYKLVEK